MPKPSTSGQLGAKGRRDCCTQTPNKTASIPLWYKNPWPQKRSAKQGVPQAQPLPHTKHTSTSPLAPCCLIYTHTTVRQRRIRTSTHTPTQQLAQLLHLPPRDLAARATTQHSAAQHAMASPQESWTSCCLAAEEAGALVVLGQGAAAGTSKLGTCDSNNSNRSQTGQKHAFTAHIVSQQQGSCTKSTSFGHMSSTPA